MNNVHNCYEHRHEHYRVEYAVWRSVVRFMACTLQALRTMINGESEMRSHCDLHVDHEDRFFRAAPSSCSFGSLSSPELIMFLRSCLRD